MPKRRRKNKYKQKRIIFVTSIFAISILALIFIVTNFKNNIVFFYSPSEFEQIKASKKLIKVGGLVKKDSVKKINSLSTEFVITDNKKDLKIHYKGILPDLFREGQGIVAKGKLNPKIQTFQTKELLVKHDENYMPPEVAKSLKKK